MRRIAKTVANLIAVALVFPLVAWFQLYSRLVPGRRESCFQGCTQALALVPGVPGDFLRRAFLWQCARECALTASIGFGTIFATPDVRIGEFVYIGPLCSIGHASIGRDTMLGTGVHLLGGARAHSSERLDIPMRLQSRSVDPIRLGCDCWVGNGAIVMADVGAHAIVGAGAVVTREIRDYEVAAGSPARVLRRRDASPGAMDVQ